MRKNSILRKVLAVSLAAVMLTGTGFTTAGQFIGTNGISVSATENDSDFYYYDNEDNTVSISGYKGNGGTVVIPSKIDGKTVTKIAHDTFRACTKLTSVIIGNSITSIGDRAFYNCTGLTSVTMPDSMTLIGSGAFCGCTSLERITIPDSVTSIGSFAFSDCTGLTGITIGNSVTSIDSFAFSGCRGLTSITIPDSVTDIGSFAFRDCSNLASITVSDNIAYIRDSAFRGTAWYKNQPDGIVYIGKVLYKYKGTMPENTAVKIPDGVKYIGDEAFYNCLGLKSITIPDSVNSIGYGAFSYCSNLTSIIVPKGVTSIEKHTFFGCDALKKVTLPNSLTHIGGGAFGGCENLTSIVIPKGVVSIEEYAFSSCTALADITIPDTLESVGDGVFEDTIWYNNLPDGVVYIGKVLYGYIGEMPKNTQIVVPDGIVAIGYGAFWGQTNLKSIVIPEGVRVIGNYSFFGCTGLTDISIPKSVKSVGIQTFYDCFNVKFFIFPNHDVSFNYATFQGCGSGMIVYYDNEIVLGKKAIISFEEADGWTEPDYAVLYKKKSDTKWINKQNFEKESRVEIKPDSAGVYDVCVKVRDSSGKIKKAYFEIKVNAGALKNTSSISSAAINKGDTVTVKASATGGTGNYTYAVYYKQTSQSKWTTAQDFSKNTTVTFKPAKAAAYDVCVKVKDGTGKIERKYFTVNVKEKLNNTSTISAAAIRQGASVTLKGSAAGGAGNYTYAVYYKQKAQSKWTAKQNFSENSVISVKPAQATDYDICIKVKDKDGTIAKKYFTVTVTK